MGYYFMETDENGVDCVDRIFDDSLHQAVELASQYPEVIYFRWPY